MLDEVGERGGWYDRIGKEEYLENKVAQQGEARQTKKVKEGKSAKWSLIGDCCARASSRLLHARLKSSHASYYIVLLLERFVLEAP